MGHQSPLFRKKENGYLGSEKHSFEQGDRPTVVPGSPWRLRRRSTPPIRSLGLSGWQSGHTTTLNRHNDSRFDHGGARHMDASSGCTKHGNRRYEWIDCENPTSTAL